jgi:uridine phosphorylase
MFNWQSPFAPVFDSEGRIQPLNCKRGELANRILSVGDPNRAAKLRDLLDKDSPVITRQSNMIFAVYTGKFHGVPVSIIATGMGFAMIELLIVQARAVTEGPLTILRFGTCGSLSADVPVGCFAVTDKVYGVRQHYEDEAFPYEITQKSFDMDAALTQKLVDSFKNGLPEYRLVVGPGISADTFYGSQGRLDDAFNNQNDTLIQRILERDPQMLAFEMESFILGYLANVFPASQIRGGALCITLAQRASGDFLKNEQKYDMESRGGQIMLEVLSQA